MKTNYKWFHLIVFSESVSLTMRTVYFDLWESSRCRGLERKLGGFFLVGLPSRSLWRMSCSSADSWEKSMFKDIFFKMPFGDESLRERLVWTVKVSRVSLQHEKNEDFERVRRENLFFFFRFAWGGDLARGSHVRDSVFYFYIFTVICFISFRLWNHPEEYSRV